MRLLRQSCPPKQIDLQVFLLLQLPYCVSVLDVNQQLHNTNVLLLVGASTKYFNKTNLD